jgi:2-amino-4-hydroxy-6-hydroxymethyldihydropteridine diphosphokinase
VGIGSNMGDSRARVRDAFAALGALPGTRLMSRSPLYLTAPFGPVEQGAFVNAVAGLLTQLSVGAFFGAMRAAETALGRRRGQVRWGPREIDLDLLVFGELRVAEDELVLPHPGIPERDFVLYPLRDVAPGLSVPGLGLVSELAARVLDRGMRLAD